MPKMKATEAPPPEETKEECFERLARARVRKAVKSIQLIGNLGDRSRYASTPEQVGKIKAVLEKQIERTIEKLGGNQEGLFEL